MAETLSTPDNKNNNEPNEIEVFWAFVAYLFFFLPFLSRHRKSKFVWYHLKQGFSLFIIFILAYFLAGIFVGLGWKIIIYAIVFVLWCFGIAHVFFGKEKPLPVFGWIAEKIL